MLKNIIIKYKHLLLYFIFGGLSTIINVGSYFVLNNYIFIKCKPSVSIVISNILAWIITILFVYLTNRKAVFNSNATTVTDKIHELSKFIASRLTTLLLEYIILFIGYLVLPTDKIIFKTLAQIIVIVANYIMSKKIVFKHE